MLAASIGPPPAAAAGDPLITVTSVMEIGRGPTHRASVHSILTVDVPATFADAQALRRWTGGRDYLNALRRSLSGYGLFPYPPNDSDATPIRPSSLHPPWLFNAAARPPTPRPSVEGGRAIVRIDNGGELNGCCLDAGNWVVTTSGGRLRVHVAAARVPAAVRWVVIVRAPYGEIETTQPLPPRLDAKGQEARWEFRTRDKRLGVTATIRLHSTQALTLKFESHPYTYYAPALQLLAIVVFFALVLRALRRWPEPRPASWAPARRAARAGLILTVAIATVLAASAVRDVALVPAADQDLESDSTRLAIVTGLFPALITSCGLAAAWRLWPSSPGARTRRRVSAAALIIAVVVYAAVAFIVAFDYVARQYGATNHFAGWSSRAQAAVALAVTLGPVIAVVGMALAVLPRPTHKRILLWAGAAIFVLVAEAQWLWAVWDFSAARAEQTRLGFGDWSGDTPLFTMLRLSTYFPAEFPMALSDLLPYLALPALLALLRASADDDAPQPEPNRVQQRLLMLLFVIAVAPTADGVFGLPVPASIALIYVALAVCLRLGPRPSTGVQPEDGDAHRRLLVARDWQANRAIRDWRLYGWLATDDDAVEPARALGDGPFAGWWHNGVAAAKLSALLAAGPIVYDLAKLVSGDWGLLGPRSYGIAYLVGQLAFDMLWWVVGGFAMGCLYARLPGRNGVVKGLAASLVTVVPQLLIWLVPRPEPWNPLLFATETFLFFVLLGFGLDALKLVRSGIPLSRLVELYAARRWQFAIGYALPVVLSTAVFINQLVQGHDVSASAQAVPEAVRNVSGH